MNIAFRTALGYGVVGSLWILLSDRVVNLIAPTPEAAARWQTIKGWGYVVVTMLLLYAVLQVYVTRQKRTERALRESEAELEAIIESAPFTLMIVDHERRVQKINAMGSDFAGRSPGEMLGLRGGEAMRCIHALDDPRGCGFGAACENCAVRRTVLDTVESGRRHHGVEADLTFVRQGEERRKTLLVHTAPLTVSGERRVLVVLQDITERKRAEEALRDSESRYRNIFHSAGVPIWEEDFSAVKASIDALRAQGVEDFGQYVDEHPDFVAQAAQMVRVRDVNRATLHMLGARDKEEVRSSLDQVFAPETLEIFRDELIAIAEGKTYFEGETVNRTLQGERRNVILTMAIPTERERLDSVLVSTVDITERKEMEQQLRQQERLAAVGQLAGGIAHDFNNILAAVILYAQMGLRQPDLAPDTRDALKTILDESHRAADLIQQILDFSRSAMMDTRPTSLVALVEETLPLLRRTIPENIHLAAELASHPCTIQADATRIHQVLMNLALNAKDAMPRGGELRIEVEPFVVGPGQSAGPGLDPSYAELVELPAGAWARLTVADTGSGMTDAAQEHLFEPFFTTKEEGEGTGLGLAQVYGIVKQHQGFIGVDTAAGDGTSVTIFLPLAKGDTAQAQADREEPSAAAAGRRAGGETVLVAEDAERLRHAVQAGLESLGYRVIAAVNGRQALEALSNREIDLVLTDVVMPEMGGEALLRALESDDQHPPVVAMTGHVVDADLEKLRDAGFAAALTKPFSIEKLTRVVREVLSR
jgi:PAS domain S-box-containing protein